MHGVHIVQTLLQPCHTSRHIPGLYSNIDVNIELCFGSLKLGHKKGLWYLKKDISCMLGKECIHNINFVFT